MATDDDKPYVCQLDAQAVEKAKTELNEDPKDRMNAVNALRTWIQQQPHLTFSCETSRLLYFLRTAKFSQLRARTLIENYAKSFTNFPHWFRDIDTHDPDLLEVFDCGYTMPLPRRDKNGCRVFIYKPGASKKNGEMLTILQQLRASTIVGGFFGMDENVQVNGYVFIFDWTGLTTKHMTRWSIEDMRNWHNCFQNAMPGRFKAFHYYNTGTLFETAMALFRPFINKKMQDRIHVHENMESLYKSIGMDLLPVEYLFDDYTGPSAGTVQQIIDNFKADIMAEEFRQMLLRRTSIEAVNVDESKRPSYTTAQESFRRLAVD